MVWLRRVLALLLLFLLVAGCSSKEPDGSPKPAPEGSITDPQTPANPPTDSQRLPPDGRPDGPVVQPTNPRRVYQHFPGGVKAFFPDGDATFTWSIVSAQAAPQYEVIEQWVHDGDRIVVARDGRPIWTWLVAADGVWAPDPKNPNVLLQYLPPNPRSGMAWRQQSGDAFVYFRLQAGPNEEAQLTVLNRGERTDYWFHANILRIAEPSPDGPRHWYGSYMPEAVPNREQILAAAPPLPERKGAIDEIGSSFTSYLVNLPGIRRELYDIDGDGLMEQIVGALGVPSSTPIELYGPDGRFLSALGSFGIAKAEVVQIDHRPRLFLMKGDRLEIHWFEHQGDGWIPVQARELGPKFIGWTYATQYRVRTDGRFEVEWEPGDPAGHRRIRTLQFGPDGKVQSLGDRWEAVDGELRAPTSPLAALNGLFFAIEFDRPAAEVTRYLAEPTLAAGLLDGKVKILNQFDGVDVWFGTTKPGMYGCEVVKSPPPDPAHWEELTPFVVNVQQYEGGSTLVGRASFEQEPDGRVLIKQLVVDGQCGSY